MKYYVYQLKDPRQSHPFYIGKGKGDRMYEHLSKDSLQSSTRKNNKIKNIINAGLDVEIQLLFDGLTEIEALRREVWAIKMWGRLDLEEGPLTNHTDGGEGISGFRFSEESKEKIRSANVGKVHTEESRKLMSESRKGLIKTEEHRKKIGDAHRGISTGPLSEETKRKMSVARQGGTPNAKQYSFLSPTGEVVEVFNLSQFCRDNNLGVDYMCMLNKGKLKAYKGWKQNEVQATG